MPLVMSNAGLAGVSAGTLVQVSAKELQDLLASAGVSIASDGVWTSSDSKSVYDFAVRTGSKPTAAQGVANNIRPYAKGRMVVVDSELLYKIMQGVPRSPVSMAGLADEYADGTYDGMSLSENFDEVYGSTMDTLEGSFNKIRGYETRTNVIDPTEGANYTGGSDWTPGMPLVMSNAGLAAFDAVPDQLFKALSRKVVSAPRVVGLLRGAGQSPLRQARMNVNAAVSKLTRPGVSPAQKVMLKAQLNASLNELAKIRAARGAVIRKASPKIARNLARRRAA
jgi:hypothetical protein